MSSFLCIKTIDSNVKKFGYNEYPLEANSEVNSVLSIFLLSVSGTQCNFNRLIFLCEAVLLATELIENGTHDTCH